MSPSSNSKRGLLRPSHSGRAPFVVLALIILLSLLLIYNLYSNSSVRNDLESEIIALGVKNSNCQENTIAVQTQLEETKDACKRKSAECEKKLESTAAMNKEANEKISKLTARLDQLTGDLKNVNSDLQIAYTRMDQFKANFTKLLDDLRNERLMAKEQKNENARLLEEKASMLVQFEDLKRKIGLSSVLKLPSNNNAKNLHTENLSPLANNENQTGDWTLSSKLSHDKLILEQENLALANGSLITTLSPRFLAGGQITKNVEDGDFMNEAISVNQDASKNAMFNGAKSPLRAILERELPEKMHKISSLSQNSLFSSNFDKNNDLHDADKKNVENLSRNPSKVEADAKLGEFDSIKPPKIELSRKIAKKGKKTEFRSGEILDDEKDGDDREKKIAEIFDKNNLEANLQKPDVSFKFKPNANGDEQYEGDKF